MARYGFYALGGAVGRYGGWPLRWGIVAVGVLAVVAMLVVVRRRWSSLVERAELAYPGPL